jgi:hypothetical protein
MDVLYMLTATPVYDAVMNKTCTKEWMKIPAVDLNIDEAL